MIRNLVSAASKVRSSPPCFLNHLKNSMICCMGDHYLAASFFKDICSYNAAFAFTSVGVKIDQSVTGGSGPYAFKINGELHHLYYLRDKMSLCMLSFGCMVLQRL